MKRARISAIVAIGQNRELGTDNQLLWRISDDLKRVKDLTTGHPLIMGRKTFESIGHPLPNRTNIIVTRDTSYTAEGCVIAHSIPEALENAHALDTQELFIFGGAQIYRDAFPYIERLYLTLIHATDPAADVFFPDYSNFNKILEREMREQNGLAYEWVTLER
ncbi:MAG: dihydrofolate reductase [Candidatus Paceibacterota bacterium]